jgi:GNAT superfamily N-acetyltransferase
MATPILERLTQKVRVRPLDAEDSLAHLTTLLHRAYKQHADRGIKALAAFQPEEVTRRRITGGECFVATYLGKVVGTILFKDARSTAAGGVAGATRVHHFERGDVATFSQFAVEPELQGRGIGSVLMDAVERRARDTGAYELALSTPEPATWLVQMYERHGYRVVERVQWRETNYMSVIMSKATGTPSAPLPRSTGDAD